MGGSFAGVLPKWLPLPNMGGDESDGFLLLGKLFQFTPSLTQAAFRRFPRAAVRGGGPRLPLSSAGDYKELVVWPCSSFRQAGRRQELSTSSEGKSLEGAAPCKASG